MRVIKFSYVGAFEKKWNFFGTTEPRKMYKLWLFFRAMALDHNMVTSLIETNTLLFPSTENLYYSVTINIPISQIAKII